jgi:hypothetical protein
MLDIGVIVQVAAQERDLALGPGNEAVLLAHRIDVDELGQHRIADAILEAGDAVGRAQILDRGGHERIGALQGERIGLGRARIGRVVRRDARHVDRGIDFVVGIDIEADAAIAVGAGDFRLQAGAVADVAGKVSTHAEAVVAAGHRAGGVLVGHAVGAIDEVERLAALVKGNALERAGGDQAILGVLIGLRMLAVAVLRRAIGVQASVDQGFGLVPVASVGAGAFAETIGGDAVLMAVFAADHHVQAAIHEGFPGCGLERSCNRPHKW